MVGNKESVAYYSLRDGKVVRSYKQAVPGLTTERTKKTGGIAHEAHYSYITGLIIGIKVRDREQFGKEWEVTLQDKEGNIEVLQFSYSCGYANAFLRCLPNIDLGKEVTITPNQKIEGDKKRTTVFINQGGSALKWFYTKDDPKGLPGMEQIKVKGIIQWDDSEQMEFLEKMVNTTIVPFLKVSTPIAAAAPAPVTADGEDDQMPEDPDGKMPF